jgi:hypothetical protein
MSQVGATCYGSLPAALEAIASGEVGKVVPAGSVVYVVDAAPSGASSIAYTLTPVGGGTAITATVPVVVPDCSLLDWSDGLVVGWGIAGVWLLAFAILQLRKAANA